LEAASAVERKDNMPHNVLETLIGALVLIVALWFDIFMYSKSDFQTVSRYTITTNFSNVGILPKEQM